MTMLLYSAILLMTGAVVFAQDNITREDPIVVLDEPSQAAAPTPEIPLAVLSLDLLNYYPVFSMETGADVLNSAYRAGVWGSGLLLELIGLDETNFWGKTAGMGLRLLKGSLLDVNFVMLAYIVEHEYFGHGTRHRESTNTFTGRMTIDVYPKLWWNVIPPFIGLSFFNSGSLTSDTPIPTLEEALIFQTAGSEANFVTTLHAQELMFRAGKLDYSLCFLYLNSRIMQFMYTAGGLSDYEYYVRFLNTLHGIADPASYSFTSSMLRDANWWNLADPFFLYSLAADVWYYWSGDQEIDLWLPEISGVSFLPSLYVNTAFFGLETYCYLTGLINKTLFYRSYVRWGDGVFHSPLETSGAGVMLGVRDPMSVFQVLDVHAWIQPLDGTSRFGASISAEIKPKILGDHVRIRAGFKSKGYLMNDPFEMCGFGSITFVY
jgi:hypothetical protein